MAAGGFKIFTTGEVLTSADTNNFLMQGVLVFADAAARDAAITAPEEGQACYLKDTDAVLTYSGSTWVGFDDSNAIQNAIVDAKGDLISATANDTPSRLGVGTNFAFLQADSAQTTGLVWNNAAWISYSPTFVANSGTFTTSSATGFYQRVGKTCIVKAFATITTVGTGLQPKLSIPFPSKSGQEAAIGAVRETSVTGNTGVAVVGANANDAILHKYDNGNYTGSGFTYIISFTYEVA